IDDCVKGIRMITNSDFIEPINLGSAELVSINQLVSIAEEIAGIRLNRSYKLDAPKGVRGRNSDNALIERVFGWEPNTRLRDGMEKTYRWIYDEYVAKYGDGPTPILQPGYSAQADSRPKKVAVKKAGRKGAKASSNGRANGKAARGKAGGKKK